MIRQTISFLLLIAAFIFSDDFDENALFADSVTVTEVSMTTNDDINKDEKKLGFSGTLTSALTAIVPQNAPGSPLSNSSLTANVLLDARLKGGIKGFVSAEAVYTPNTSIENTTFTLPEAFIDINFSNRVYLRTGKQVLQWGRGYLWNPTDLINIERKTFVQKIGLREGAYGIKAHIPFGTRLNIYGFADMRNADSIENTALSFKTEFTIKATEMAFAVWSKKNKTPVFGYDVSSSLFGISVAGEVSLFRADNESFAQILNDTLTIVSGTKEWKPRAAMTLGKSLGVNGIPNRLSLILEGYYNSTGYDVDFIKDALNSSIDANYAMPGISNAILFALSNNLYTPNNLSKYYVALFASLSRFINSNMTLNLNAIANVEQNSVLLYSALSYNDLRDLSLSLSVSQGIGPKNSEYTLDLGANSHIRNGLTTLVSAAISF